MMIDGICLVVDGKVEDVCYSDKVILVIIKTNNTFILGACQKMKIRRSFVLDARRERHQQSSKRDTMTSWPLGCGGNVSPK
jgi:hypothetical protein